LDGNNFTPGDWNERVNFDWWSGFDEREEKGKQRVNEQNRKGEEKQNVIHETQVVCESRQPSLLIIFAMQPVFYIPQQIIFDVLKNDLNSSQFETSDFTSKNKCNF